MSCWSVLGIEPTSDKKTIKIAYAKQLKLTRPDEDPEGFQILHSAYKEAQNWEDYYLDEDDGFNEEISGSKKDIGEPSSTAIATVDRKPSQEIVLPSPEVTDLVEVVPPSADLDDVKLPTDPILNEADLQLLEEIKQQEAGLDDSWAIFRDQVNALVTDNRACNEVANWSFLEAMPAMHDLEFRKNVADSLFEVIAELNEEALKHKSLYIKRPVINYLNHLFHWDKHWQEYKYRYSDSLHEAVYPYLEETEKVTKGKRSKRELHYYRRITAFTIDVAILLIILITFYLLGDNLSQGEDDGVSWAIYSMLFYVLLVIPAQESSKYQATMGKRLMGLEVVTGKGERVGFFHALYRSVVTAICCGLFKVVLWMNLILSWWKSELLQDVVSRSYVVRRPKRD